jgi:lipoprotein-releasing system permease protein
MTWRKGRIDPDLAREEIPSVPGYSEAGKKSMSFELQVALRYLRAKRKQAVISIITVISIIGVAAGVAALVIAIAINAGFRTVLQNKLLGAQPHITIQSKDGAGITDFQNMTKKIESMDGVIAAAPAVYEYVMLISSKARSPQGVFLKGMLPESESRMSDLAKNIVQGDFGKFNEDSIIVGKGLADSLGVQVGDDIEVISAETMSTPQRPVQRTSTLTLVAIFSSGLYDLDHTWAYVPLARAQWLKAIGPDAVPSIDGRLRDDDLDRAPEIAASVVEKLGKEHFDSTNWKELNESIMSALKLERLVMFLTIGLIVLVAALNIVAMLTMMVLEKTRDIAILLSMGATAQQIRRIFVWQGVIIGVVGTFFGLVVGHVVSFFADKYHLVHLHADVYTISYVPFRANLLDTVIIAAAAIMISYLATLYPSAAASKLQPVEALRYE